MIIKNSSGIINPSIHEQYDPDIILRELRAKNADRLIIAHLNINSLPNKFEPLKSLIKDRIDILVITESKLNQSFPIHQFDIGYSTSFRLDRSSQAAGGILIYIRFDIASK